MPKFQIGDRVRILNGGYDRVTLCANGDTTEVAEVVADGKYRLRGRSSPGEAPYNWLFFEPELEMAAPAPEPSDAVVAPHHYARFKIEPINFIMQNELPFAIGNVIKYVCRYDAKNGIEDLEKAKRYIDFQIALLRGEGSVTA